MELVQQSIAPLSPFTWVPEEEAATPGYANVALHDIARLDLRFELIVEEFAVPFRHPLHRIYATHPLLRNALSPRQLQLLQYGMVVDSEEQLVIVAASPCCGDSGACIAASYQQVFERAMDSTSSMESHPLLLEYTFVVYRLPAAVANDQARGSDAPEALFRLVFRNIVSQEEMRGADKAAAPRYMLVAVLASSDAYYAELQRGIQYRNEWIANMAATRACDPPLSKVSSSSSTSTTVPPQRMVPETVAREVCASSPLSQLCTSLACVLERLSPEETDVDLEGVVRKDVVDGDVAKAVAGSFARGPCVVQARDPWMYYYTREGPRLKKRIDVAQSTPAVLRAWRDGAMDLAEFQVTPMKAGDVWSGSVDPHKSTHPLLSLASKAAPCARLLLLPSHREVSTLFADNEITSFLPKAEVADEAGGKPFGVVYVNPAAERLRRWILQGLVCAEAHGVHTVFLELDPVDLIAPCVELLYEDSDAENLSGVEDRVGVDKGYTESQLRYRRALFLVCQVCMETVELFVRCSGLVWKVTVAVKELGGKTFASRDKNCENAAVRVDASKAAFTNVPFTLWCGEILDVIRKAAVALESRSALNTLSFPDEGESAVGDDAAVAAAAVKAAPLNGAHASALIAQPESSRALVTYPKEGIEGALALFSGDAVRSTVPVPPYIAAQAEAAGVKVGDDAMHPLFKALCAAARQQDTLPVSSLVDVLLHEWTGGSPKSRRRLPLRLICPLDSCGVPVNRSRVQRFLLPFLQVMRSSPGVRTGSSMRTENPDDAGTVNYAQFSMVMLAIAKM
ncbi:paraflagellar rod component, putative [Leishmania donovani]|uniref:Paraflagellar rod component, putative n=1 Tax=Leishmania donovani TaxID=5661 RepID=A0A3Q8IJ99_LEIDO|nr:paraflagellar rod component, putative [Leishmania donovani]